MNTETIREQRAWEDLRRNDRINEGHFLKALSEVTEARVRLGLLPGSSNALFDRQSSINALLEVEHTLHSAWLGMFGPESREL